MELTPFFFGLYKLVKYGVYPLTWAVGLAGLTLILTWLPPTPTRRRHTRLAATMTCLILFLATTPIIAKPLTSLLESWPVNHPGPSTPHAHAIVVLGGGIYDKGTLRPSIELSPESRQRTLCGAELYHQGLASTLLITGGDLSLFGSGPTEPATMKEWAIRLGVPASAILTDDRARTTYENALGTKRLLGEQTSILLVSSAGHLWRATALFEKQGFHVTPYACGFHAKHRVMEAWKDLTLFDFLPASWALQRTTEVAEEVAGMIVYKLIGKL